MHVQRQSYALRLCVLAVLWMAAPGALWWMVTITQEELLALRPELPSTQLAVLPSDTDHQHLLDALEWVLGVPSQPVLDTLESSLVSPRQDVRTIARLSMLMHRGREPLAMIDGRVFREGDTLPDGRVIEKISAQGVVLLAGGQAELTPWIPPFSVRLEKAATPPMGTNGTLSANATVATPVQNGTMTLDAMQAMQLLKQLETMQHHAQ